MEEFKKIEKRMDELEKELYMYTFKKILKRIDELEKKWILLKKSLIN
jgi:tetrahydromethanopterin S-methyltransferase subunit G